MFRFSASHRNPGKRGSRTALKIVATTIVCMSALHVAKNSAMKTRFTHDAKSLAWAWADLIAGKSQMGISAGGKSFAKQPSGDMIGATTYTDAADLTLGDYLLNWNTRATMPEQVTALTPDGRHADFCTKLGLCQQATGLRLSNSVTPIKHRGTFRRAVETGKIQIDLTSKSGPRRAVVFVPIIGKNRVRGVVRAHVRQTDKGYALSRSVDQAWIAFAGLALVLMVALALVNWRRIEERLRAERDLRYYAHHDALTDLPNRFRFQQAVREAFASFPSNGDDIYLMIVDLDGFKELNDTLGHPVGDGFLVEVGKRLQKQAGDEAFVARMGGDEFAILMQGKSIDDRASALADRLMEVSKHRIQVDNHFLPVSMSVGLACTSGDCRDNDTLMRHADLALYEAKHQGRGRWVRFEPSLEDALRSRQEIEHGLRRAIRLSHLELHYEPQFSLATRQLYGHEALVRWRDPDGRLRMPGEFLEIAEQTGLITDLGRWVIARACQDGARYPELGRIAINISPEQFRVDDIGGFVAETLSETGMRPERLGIEITEGILFSETEENIAKLNRLKELGVQIALDDFGTGYSSLSYLASFSFDCIKIDRSFTLRLGKTLEVNAVVAAIVGIGNSLNVSILAEGVEDDDHIILLKAAGCHLAQGWYFGRPLPALEAAQKARDLASQAEEATAGVSDDESDADIPTEAVA